MRVFVNVVTCAHIDRWICVYVSDVTRLQIHLHTHISNCQYVRVLLHL
jgi:hypothetical protein